MKFKTKLLICLLRRYFDTGFGILNYVKYPLVVLGISFPNVRVVVLVSFIYALICFGLGWAWIKYDFFKAEQEISNKFNLFVLQVRKKLLTKVA